MKKYLLLLILPLLLSLVFIACEDDSTGPDPVDSGYLRVESTPTGASIFLNSESTRRGETNSVITVPAGTHRITLKLTGYRDTTITNVVVAVGDTSFRRVQLTVDVNPPTLTKHEARIYESFGTGADKPSGLDLSEGDSVSALDARADLYYYTTLGAAVHELRRTNAGNASFYIAAGTNLEDTVDSPLATNAWLSAVSDEENNYFFVFDDDSHYSKVKIVDISPVSEVPLWVDIEWYYNESANDPRFGDNN